MASAPRASSLFTEVSVREDGSASSVIVVVDPSTGETHLSAEFDEALQATALVVDADGDGRLELVLVGSRDSLFGTETGRRPASWVLHRLDLGAPVPDVVRWGGYLGTNHDGRYEPTEPRP